MIWAPQAVDRLWSFLFPARCYGCGRRGAVICQPCEPRIPWLGPERCPRCARPSPVGRICSQCVNRPSDLDALRAACAFEGPIRQLVHDLKYGQARTLAEFCSGLLHRAIQARPLQVDVLVPVPLARGRARERGYNQAELIARGLSERLGVPIAPDLLVRIRETPAQVGRSRRERERNVKGAFECASAGAAIGSRVALIDDVATTGATLRACAQPLKAAGATRVIGLVVARD